MAKRIIPENLAVLSTLKKLPPTIMTWNRLEGRPRTTNFSRALKAEVRDPLWMISKQWQMGEFQGEDAGSVVLAKVHMRTTKLSKYQAGEEVTAYDEQTPLEVQVEHQPIPFDIGGQEVSLDIRLQMGRHWSRLLKSAGFTLKDAYIEHYGFHLSTPPTTADDSSAQVYAHLETWQQLAAVSKRAIDGYKLYSDLKNGSDLVAAPSGQEAELAKLREKFMAWFEGLYHQPKADNNPSWRPSYLEHQFECAAPENGQEKVYRADEFYHGHLDWYNLDVHDQKQSLEQVANDGGSQSSDYEDELTLSFFPSSVSFPGMPHSRWWTFEDWKTNLGNINPNTTDLNQLMLLDFGLNYANDWFVFPFTLPVGSIANVEGLMVTNVFGEHTWVQPANKGADEDWDRWAMFNNNVRGDMDVPADLSLLLVPAAAKVLEGKPLEEIFLVRDEMANMVWAVETQVPLRTGKSKSGKEAGMELRNKYQQLIEGNETELVPSEAKIRYQLVNSVPEEWIPFIPVRVEGSKRQIQLQRAAMPRLLEGDLELPAKITPRTTLLREGLDKTPKETFFLHEEEVVRAGIKVKKGFQRTRWFDGQVFNWVGIRKQVGRGEGHSGLAFDQIIPQNTNEDS